MEQWRRSALNVTQLEAMQATCLATVDTAQRFSLVQQFWSSLGGQLVRFSGDFRKMQADHVSKLDAIKFQISMNHGASQELYSRYSLLIDEMLRFYEFATLNCFSVRQLLNSFCESVHTPLSAQLKSAAQIGLLQNFNNSVGSTLNSLLKLIDRAADVTGATQYATSQQVVCSRCCSLMASSTALPCQHRACQMCADAASAGQDVGVLPIPLCLFCVTTPDFQLSTQRRQVLSGPQSAYGLPTQGGPSETFVSAAAGEAQHAGSKRHRAEPSISSSPSPAAHSSALDVKRLSLSADNEPEVHVPPRPASSTQRGSCHHCKTSKSVDLLRTCCTQPRRSPTGAQLRRCRKKFCLNCLRRSYPTVDATSRVWFCPACQGICLCAVCKRKQDQQEPDDGEGVDECPSASADSVCAKEEPYFSSEPSLVPGLAEQHASFMPAPLDSVSFGSSSPPNGDAQFPFSPYTQLGDFNRWSPYGHAMPAPLLSDTSSVDAMMGP